MIKKVKLLGGNLPVLSVVEDNIPRVYEKIMRFFMDYAVDYRKLDDEKDEQGKYLYPPDKLATMLVTIGLPHDKPQFHERYTETKSYVYEDIAYYDKNIRKDVVNYVKTYLSATNRECQTTIIDNHYNFCLLVNEDNSLSLNMNVVWKYKRNFLMEWYLWVLEMLEVQKEIAEELSNKIKDVKVVCGRYCELNPLFYFEGKRMNNEFFQYYEKILTQNVLSRIIDKE